MAFHLGCLRALDDLGVLSRIKVMSTISGGSVIGAYYAYTPQKSFAEFEIEIRQLLRVGLQNSILLEFLKPWNALRSAANSMASLIEIPLMSAIGRQSSIKQYPTRSDCFERVLRRGYFSSLKMKSPRRNSMEVVVGACELRTGTAFRFSSLVSGSWRHGELATPDIDLSLAIAASAAFPLLLPAFERRWEFVNRDTRSRAHHDVQLTDGGVYDNLGVSVLEPERDERFSLHSFPTEHLIVCSAGHGQASGSRRPRGLLTRMDQSFGIVHRRVQDAAMAKLHALKAARKIRGFALPYLGQQDDMLPWAPADLVPRSEVVKYPTNFSPMKDVWIDKLSMRGEQLTRVLVPHYMPEICG